MRKGKENNDTKEGKRKENKNAASIIISDDMIETKTRK